MTAEADNPDALKRRLGIVQAHNVKLGNELAEALAAVHHGELVRDLLSERRDDKARAEFLQGLSIEELRAVPVDWEVPPSQRCPTCGGKGRLPK